jgi:hypothetical protein
MGRWIGVVGLCFLTVSASAAHAVSLTQMQYAIQHQQCPERRAANTSPEQVCPTSRELAAQMPKCMTEAFRRQMIINAYNEIFEACSRKNSKKIQPSNSKIGTTNTKIATTPPRATTKATSNRSPTASTVVALASKKMNWCSDQKLYWSQISSTNQQFWASLGWTQNGWDTGSPKLAPASDQKEWKELTKSERNAASQLGFNSGNWGKECTSRTQPDTELGAGYDD